MYNCLAQNTFIKTFSGYVGYNVEQTYDGGYIIVGEVEKDTGFYSSGTYISLTKTDEYGNILWCKTYGGLYRNKGYSIKQTLDSGYIIAGFFGIEDFHSEGWGNIYVIKIDLFGNIIWSRILGGGTDDGDYGLDVKQTTDGEYIVAGMMNYSLNGGNPVAFLAKLDNMGNKLWIKQYGELSVANSVLETNDRGFIFTGYNGLPSRTYLVKTDSLGDTLWTKMYFKNSNGSYGYSIRNTANNNFVITGYLADQNNNYSAYLITVDQNGNKIWSRIYDRPERDYSYSVSTCFDSGYIIIGATENVFDEPILIGDTISLKSTGFDIWVVRTNKNGDTLWTKIFIGIGYDKGHSINQTSDGGFIITGRTSGFTDYLSGDFNYSNNIFLIKMDSLGNCSWPPWINNYNNKFRNVSAQVNIMPNPFTSSTTLSIKLPSFAEKNSKFDLILYDIYGREVKKTTEIETKQVIIKRDNLPEGIYFYQLFSKERLTFTGKMVIQ